MLPDFARFALNHEFTRIWIILYIGMRENMLTYELVIRHTTYQRYRTHSA